jgi:cytochrome d ubiquinol oxidase subunit I
MTTEIGRQPWLVYGVMRTADGVSAHGVLELTVTLALFVVIYFAVFGAGLVYLLRLIALGPAAPDAAAPMDGGAGQPRQAMRPLSAAGAAPAD